jgi:hypothetical protein
MPDSPSSLPERPSLEQLQKLAKELLRQRRAGDPAAASRLGAADACLADAQFVIAREHGFESWAKLKHHIEAVRPTAPERFERLAQDLAVAYMAGDKAAIREVNWANGTQFAADLDPVRTQERLVTWFGSEDRAPERALADARLMVAQAYGFEGWDSFAAGLAKPPGDPRSHPLGISSSPPFYKIDLKERALHVRGPQAPEDWDTIFSLVREYELTSLYAGAITDAAMERMPQLDHLTHLDLGGSTLLGDEGARHLARMPQLEILDMGGWKSPITDRAFAGLRSLTRLRQFKTCWTQGITDAAIVNLEGLEHLEEVNLMGTPTGDGAIATLAGKSKLRRFHTGRSVTDAGIPLLHGFPVFAAWQGGEMKYGLMGAGSGPNHLMLDGPFTNQGLTALAGLDGLFGVSFFWHCPAFTSAGLAPLKDLANLGFVGCEGERCDDEAMRHIAAIPRLRMLMGQGTVAGDAGFTALSRSRTLEYIWGRESANLRDAGFAALASMPALRGIAMSLQHITDAGLSALPHFPALVQLDPMDVTDDAFRHVGACTRLQALWCMYCRDTGDRATEHIADLKLKSYYAGATQITDRSLEILGRMASLVKLEFWQCGNLTDAGVAHLTGLPRLREISLDGLTHVTRDGAARFPATVRVNYTK